MLRLPLLVTLLTQVTHPIRTAYVTSSPSFADRLDRIFEKFDRLTGASQVVTHAPEKWESKLEKFRSLSPESVFLSDDEEELLSAMQSWGGLSPAQLQGVAQDLQRMRADTEEDGTVELTDPDYADMDDNDEEYADYRNDGKEDEDDEEPESSSSSPRIPPGVTPSAYTRHGPYRAATVYVNPITATNERPVILEDLSDADKRELREAALRKAKEVFRASKCRVQSRWLSVRQLAPAADTVYIPPCVNLHRCSSDSGCCTNDSQVCAPVEGNFVTLPFLLQRANISQRGMLHPVRMLFYNHTRCDCISHTSYQSAMQEHHYHNVESEERQKDWLPPATTQPPTVPPNTVQPLSEEDVTAPPQMRRCTCPTLFLASMSDSGNCSCGCDWRDTVRRRECLLFTRGREHLALRDRVCIANGDCAPPACDYGAYDTTAGRCPVRKFRRVRYHVRPRQHDKNVV